MFSFPLAEPGTGTASITRPPKRRTPPLTDDDDNWDGLQEMPPDLAQETAAAVENRDDVVDAAASLSTLAGTGANSTELSGRTRK
jgi:hypothetical protein